MRRLNEIRVLEYMAADDLALITVEIKLPALGLSKGSIAAIGLAVYCLEKIVSLFLVSRLGLEKPVAGAKW
ncbi:uncharacterized protein ARMOST_02280 [Armillaria ostoyae]|uniref:Uncharacterized protein n=1 Tax=Armillaria ostoyae TaxID=47428 RepID=A0A284QR89_ARMOS|nr:uncharacterized protein ARMOST_02280 [Armillaria ostoyae]